jgi:hypothetical protein
MKDTGGGMAKSLAESGFFFSSNLPFPSSFSFLPSFFDVVSGQCSFISCTYSRMTLSTIANSSKGCVSITGGGISIVQGQFEENNPHLPLSLLFRRNIQCSAAGKIDVLSLKRGDGVQNNTSFWILASSDCSFSGIAFERVFPFFIPSIDKVGKDQVESNYLFSITGNLLLPCNLSFSVFGSSGSIAPPIPTVIYTNDSLFSGSIPISTIDSHPSDEISVVLLFPRFAESTGSTESSAFVIQNKSDEEDKDEHSTESNNPSSDPDSLPLFGYVIIVFLAVLFLVALSAFLFMMY